MSTHQPMGEPLPQRLIFWPGRDTLHLYPAVKEQERPLPLRERGKLCFNCFLATRAPDALGFLLAFALTALMDSVFHDVSTTMAARLP